MNFKIKKKYLTYEEKLDRVREYNEFEEENINEEEFAKRDIYDEYIDFKCLKCGVEHELEADIVFKLFEPEYEEYPEWICNDYKGGTMVPINIYNKLKKK